MNTSRPPAPDASESPTRPSNDAAKPPSLWIGVVVGCVSIATLFLLFRVIGSGSDDGKDAVRRFLMASAIPQSMERSTTPPELEELRAFRGPGVSVRIDNFYAHKRSACYSVTLSAGGQSASYSFVLDKQGESFEVTTFSRTRDCRCPVDFDQPCGLQ